MRKRVYVIGVSSLFLSIIFLFTASVVHASLAYTIKKGDTLACIAKKYRIRLKDLQKENKVSARHLRPGAVITIPAKAWAGKRIEAVPRDKESPVAFKATLGETGGREAVSEAAQGPDTLSHTVRRGDTVVSVAQKYSLDQDDLKELNGPESSRLKKGEKLIVEHMNPKTYTVRRGDNLWKIAKKFGMDSEALISLNELHSPALTVGQKLYLEEKVDSADAETCTAEIERHVDIEEAVKQEAESEEFTHKPLADKLVAFAKKLVDIPYKFGGNSILGIDCSAYVKKVYGLLGIELPRTAREQFKTGETVGKDELSIGDLVFFRTYASFPSHVGIYLGNNLFIHASSRGKKVTINSLETPYYLKRFIGGKRLLIEESRTETDPHG